MHRLEGAAAAGLSYGIGLNAVSGTIAGTGTSAIRAQGGHTVANAMIGYRFNEAFSLSLNGNNLTDKTYYTRLGGTNSYNSYGEPRNFTLTARYAF
jgi:outer membrane receptor for ferric coprogen and ferric-rhodotorulic acid